MKTFIITYNHIVYKPSSYDLFKSQQAWSLSIEASELSEAENILKTQHNKNPFYFTFTESSL